MSYSGGMSQYAHDMQEQENESGLDLCEAWHHELELNRIRKFSETAQPDSCKRIAPPIDAYQKPF